jgi:hypothetical protein
MSEFILFSIPDIGDSKEFMKYGIGRLGDSKQ